MSVLSVLSVILRLRHLRRVAVEGAFVVLILLLMLAVLEGALRLLSGDDPIRAPAPRPKGDLATLHKTSDLAQPNIRGLNAGALYETNSAGFRGREHPEQRPADSFRLAIIGDSTAMGWGVEVRDTYAARIERHFNSAKTPRPALPSSWPPSGREGSRGSDGSDGSDSSDPSQRLEVLNFALAGLDAGGVSKRFEELALRYEPDLLIYGFTLNDIRGDHYRHSLDRHYAESLRHNRSAFRLWRWARPRWLAIRELLFAPKGTYAGELDDNYFNNPAAWQALQSHLTQIARLSDERGICRILLINSQIQSLHALHPYRRHYEAVATFARELDFQPAQSLARMTGEEASALWVSPSDWHANARGHAILAEIALDALIELPARCWKR